ncbi:MAG: hypothetical protein DCF31_05590 [Alphaproteobacteria bacterium]|nr:MAG: hypothetical protein DCF31_05590 [Alphaproteobacteria bacterium]
MTANLQWIGDRIAIADVMARYTRGIDRCDLDALCSVWWPGATADYGDGDVDALEWSAATVTALAALNRTQHFIGNLLVDIDGDTATAECYCRAYHEAASPDGATAFEVGGRYLDRLERRDDQWRIVHRRYVMDWNSNAPSTAEWDDGLYARLTRRGTRYPADPLYTGS